MGRFSYRVIVEFSPNDGAFVARVPAFGEFAAHGGTPEEAVTEAVAAVARRSESMRRAARPLPEEDATARYSGQLRLRLPPSLHEKVSKRALDEGVSLNLLLSALIAEGMGRRRRRGPVRKR
jgi:antitoxin HicB